jgi:hypothetical protein
MLRDRPSAISHTAPTQNSDAPEQIDIHHGLPGIQTLKRVALIRNPSIIEQYGNLKIRLRVWARGKRHGGAEEEGGRGVLSLHLNHKK